MPDARRAPFPVLEHASLANAVASTSTLIGLSGIVLLARGALLPALLWSVITTPFDVLER